MTGLSPRRAAFLAGGVLFLVYGATLAPGVTLWDAGEFAAAVESLGIPHPPGTPLYVLIARAWRLGFSFLPAATATNLLAAVSSAVAAGIATALVATWLRDGWAAVAGGIVLGGMSTVWLNATETEVYSASLLLSVVMVWTGAGAGAEDRRNDPRSAVRWDCLLAYLFALAPPLHLSALVAAPAAIVLATTDSRNRIDGWRATRLSGAAMLAAGIGTVSPAVSAIGVLVVLAPVARTGNRPGAEGRASIGTLGVIAVAASAFLFLLLRSRTDPAINQGYPTTLAGLIDVVGRRQYELPGLWPRRAPLWLQIGNLFQYTDWQFALGLDSAVGASWLRTPFTPLFVTLCALGSVAHWRRDRRSWLAVFVLLLSATLGVVVYLNLRAGPSFGYGILPPNAEREARERDYFFALGFATFGLWAGQGAMALARRAAARFAQPRLVWGGLGLAALPILLNWRAVDRRREPVASLAIAFATATLESTPRAAVLFVAGDNDTYPLWYAQVGRRIRRDVSIVTVPLLGAAWYRAELARRGGLYDPADTASWRGVRAELASVADHARRAGRPVVAAVALEPNERQALGDRWVFRGLVYVRADSGGGGGTSIDVHAVDSTAALVSRAFPGPVDPARVEEAAARYITSLLGCPALAQQAAAGDTLDTIRLLASRCNYR